MAELKRKERWEKQEKMKAQIKHLLKNLRENGAALGKKGGEVKEENPKSEGHHPLSAQQSSRAEDEKTTLVCRSS